MKGDNERCLLAPLTVWVGPWNDNNNKGGMKPGRGRGAPTIASKLSPVKIIASEWGAAAKPASSSNG